MVKINQRKKDALQKGNGRPFLSSEQMAEYCRRIVCYLETEKRYRYAGYSLWELSRETGISMKIISRSINGYMRRNFHDLINRFRIEEAKSILREAAVSGKDPLIENVGMQCGFHSRSVFFARFNAYEGMSPKKYMNLYRTVNHSDN